MTRAYIVIPEGTRIVRMSASTPHFAASKARRGKGEFIDVTEALVVPASSAFEIAEGAPAVIAGQLSWGDDGVIERA